MDIPKHFKPGDIILRENSVDVIIKHEVNNHYTVVYFYSELPLPYTNALIFPGTYKEIGKNIYVIRPYEHFE